MKNTRLYVKYSLVFFLLLILAACTKHSKNITLLWKDNRAISIQIPERLIRDVSLLRVKHSVTIILTGGKDRRAIFGDFTLNDDVVVFKPLIPLSPGLSYTILQDNRLIGTIQVPLNTETAPQLIAIYPEKDTLPENQLKFYIRFSKPMRTGQSLDYICLLDQHQETMRNVFLNLQPELWDTTGSVLTVWLDPGRIKRGLVLNKKLGNPLKSKESYTLIISQRWKDSRGVQLTKDYAKQFFVSGRDEQVPDITTWQLNSPEAGTILPFIINTNKPLDHYLLQESVQITTNDGTVIKGTNQVTGKDQVFKFTPATAWKSQPYKIRVKSNLEDLAGNNLNRVFDRDITKDKQQRDKIYYERAFEVRP